MDQASRKTALSSVISREREVNGEENELRKGHWTAKEDHLLMREVAVHGEGRWKELARNASNTSSCNML